MTREEIECPSDDFTPGKPAGKCWGDGHYQCKGCIHYREDFARLGQDFIDFAHVSQDARRFLVMDGPDIDPVCI